MLVDIDLNKYAEYSEIRSRVNEKSDFENDVLEYFKTRQFGILGDKLPFSSAEQKIGFRRKEITVLAGVNGHGKSLILDLKIGDIVTIHWGWVCEKIDKVQLAHLKKYTEESLVIFNCQAGEFLYF